MEPGTEPTVTVIVAALNEERGLEATVRTVLGVVPRWFADWEILIVDDGSTDATGEIADRLAATAERVTAVHHPRPSCLGGVFQAGLRRARMAHVILLNGKDDTPAEALDRILSLRGRADLIIPVQANGHERPLARRLLSRGFVSLLNAASGLELRYYNHSVLHRAELLRSIELRTRSYGFQAEAIVKLLRRGASYLEVEVDDRFDAQRATRASSWSNVSGIARLLLGTFYDVRVAPALGFGRRSSARPA